MNIEPEHPDLNSASISGKPAPVQMVEEVGPYLATAKWLAREFSQPFAKAAIERGLPSNYESHDKQILQRVLSAIGLKSRFVKRDIAKLDPVVLPCVLFSKNNNPIILVAIDGGEADIIEPTGSGLRKIQIVALKDQTGDDLLLVTPEADATNKQMDPHNLVAERAENHWLWPPIIAHKGAWLQIFLAALGINILALALPIFVMNVYDRVIPNLAMVTLWTLAGGVTIALVLDLLLKLVRTNVLERAGRRIDLKIASNLFQHAMNVKLLERKGGATGIASQIRDFEQVRDFFTSSSFVALVDLLFIGIFITVLWIIVGPIALVPLLAVPIVIILAFIAQIPIGNSVEETRKLSSKRHQVLMESLSGIETIKSLNGEKMMQREWENTVAASSRISGKTRFWSNFAISTTMAVQQGVSIVIILWGVYLVSDGTITVGGLIAANLLAGRVLAPLGNVSQTIVRAQQALKSFAAISEFMKLPTESSATVQKELTVKEGNVRFQNVSFTYPEAKIAALSEVSLAVSPGEIIGVLGRVGSGKTTLGKMFVGLIEPASGIILIDGKEIQQYDPAVLREGIGYLPQDPELFTGTIRENLLLGKPDASEDEIRQALYYAGMDYFLGENPEGLNQFIGERGNRLSGGQRQAICIARLLLRAPKTLFLDEPTNAMDHATEALVTARLKELAGQNVALVISTHRQSLAAICDKLVVLDGGKKLMDGPSDEVFKKLAMPVDAPSNGKGA